MAWTASLAHDEVQLRSRLATAEATLQQLEVKSKPVVALRDAALQDAQRAHALAALVTGPQALLVIEHLLTRLPALPGLMIRQLELSGRQVRLALEVPQGIERAAIVTALEEGRWLDRCSRGTGIGRQPARAEHGAQRRPLAAGGIESARTAAGAGAVPDPGTASRDGAARCLGTTSGSGTSTTADPGTAAGLGTAPIDWPVPGTDTAARTDAAAGSGTAARDGAKRRTGSTF